jgi:3',5'-cyclic AMP phosphodiesterase CpdA
MLDRIPKMKKQAIRAACLASVVWIAPAALGQQSVRPAPVAAEAYQPTAFPDRIILTFTGDPAHTQAVTWRSDATAANAQAQVALADHGPQFESQARSVPAATVPLATKAGEARCHTVVFGGLEPRTKYLYRVGDGSHWSEWAAFQTAAAGPEPFRFLYLGDAQNSIKSHWSRVIRAAFASAPDARFIVHAGDLVNRGTDDSNWGEWFQAAGWINAMVPCLPSPGNHEYEKSREETARDASHSITGHWRAQFALPQNGPKGLEETAYFIDYQGARIISLNSNEGLEKQADWLHEILGRNPNRWTIITFHHPIYSSAKARDNAEIRKLWQPIFDKYHVDLVLQGHDHTYARTGLQIASAEDSSSSAANPGSGTVYVNSVAGPKQYVLDRKPEQKRTAEGTQLFQVISIDGDTLRLEARTALGDLYDAFALKKRTGQANEFIEQGPGTPERHPQIPAEKPKAKAKARATAALVK